MQLRTINIALSPNSTWKDIFLAKWLLMPWNWPTWQKGRAVQKLEAEFRKMMGVDLAMAVGSGREALYLILKSLDLSPGDEIILQGFTCMVVVNSIIWNGLKPVYVDADTSYNLSVSDLSKKITDKTRAVIVQHTFGVPANIEEIKILCEEKNLILIEDCAHALGASIGKKKVGTIGDIGFYSLGRSKVVSCVSGGMIVTKNKKFIPALEKINENLKMMPRFQIMQNLMHPIICSWAKTFYFSPVGKVIMVAGQKLKLINLEVTREEKQAKQPKNFGTKLSNAMSQLALSQLKLLNKFNRQRRRAADYYSKNIKVGIQLNPSEFPGAIFLRYPILVSNPEKVLREAKKVGVILGDWYSTPIAPADSHMEKTGYINGSCTNLEKMNKKIINLPTMHDLNQQDLEKIVGIVNQYAEN